MTTRSARTGHRCARNPTGHGQAHLNKFAFRHNPNSTKTRAIAKIAHRRVCSKCYDILEWRKAFRKYKPSKHARRCDECRNHSITTAYHVICEPCSLSLHRCAKCKVEFDAANPLRESDSVGAETPDQVVRALAAFKERNRRSMTRAIENGVFTLQEVLRICDAVGNLRTGSRTSSPFVKAGEEEGEDEQESDLDLHSCNEQIDELHQNSDMCNSEDEAEEHGQSEDRDLHLLTALSVSESISR